MVQGALELFRPYNTMNLPSSGFRTTVDLDETRDWGVDLETRLTAVTVGMKTYATKAAMDADTTPAINTGAACLDPVAENSGFYRKSAAANVAGWTKLSSTIPGQQVVVLSDTGAGTANALATTSGVSIPTGAYQALILLSPFEANTAAATLANNGGTAYPIQFADGTAIVADTLQPGQTEILTFTGASYRLIARNQNAIVSLTAGGTGNAITATVPEAFSLASGKTIFITTITAANTGAVTVQLNGGTALPLQTNTGAELVSGYLAVGMVAVFMRSGSTYRLLSDVASSAIQTAAAASAAAASASAAVAGSVAQPLSFATVANLLADTVLSYTSGAGKVVVAAGMVVGAAGYRYQVQASSATDHHLATDGVVKLKILPLQDGSFPINALGVLPGGDLSSAAAFIDATTDLPLALTLSPGSYTINSTGLVLKLGRSIDLTGVTIDASAATGSFANGAVVAQIGTEPTALPALASDVARYATTVTFSAAHGLAAGDLFMIYDPTDGSYNNIRTVYRKGEYCVVATVVSATEITVRNPLYDSYTAAVVGVWSCSGYANGGSVVGGRIIAPVGSGVNKNVAALRAKYVRGHYWNDVNAVTTGSYAVLVENCFDGKEADCIFEQRTSLAATGTFYARMVANCQNYYSSGCTFSGQRHGSAVGGGNTFATVNREIHITDFYSEAADVAAVDFHGNTEWSSYTDGTCVGFHAFALSGNHNVFRNLRGKTFGSFVYASEMKGTNFIVEGLRGVSFVNDVNRGVIDIGGNNVPMSADTTEGGTIRFSDIDIFAPLQTKHAVVVRNRGCAQAWGITFDNVLIDVPGNVSSWQSIVISAVSGTGPTRVQGTQIDQRQTGDSLTLGSGSSGALMRQDSISGVVTITPGTGSSNATATVTFPRALAKTPVVTVSLATALIGGKVVVPVALSVSNTGFTARVNTADGANFSTTTAGDVAWEARLWEW